MSPIPVPDIETAPNTDGLRTLYAMDDTATPQQMAEEGGDFRSRYGQ